MNIGQAAKASGISAKMIRYYEQIGLIPPANRRESGYRHYSASDVHMLRFIRRGRDLGFPMAQINELLGLWRDRSRQSVEVKRIATAHMTALREKIDSLEQIASTLQTLIECCTGDDRPDCPILADLENTADRQQLSNPSPGSLKNLRH
ncbi:Cu(I)-responsive transcriptional regulator [Pollutimonas subterranea]|uniref:Cu(I)-responsive transcriptional regulator n=1 Tax=Pollutimonas subterranea TaxID=2045210 RepID=A0A2N4U761_9BURK|nr:Cu(I)-responsive transcriptional regulator [Pollutimonas subterranea]PLC50864.1 Cu(I)-responsive transcriptional regulator [Pollutimonas subterranea]